MEDYDLTTQPGRAHLYFNASMAEFGAPQYWFGYGLSYTRFEYSTLTLKLQNDTAAVASTAEGNCAMTASVRVKNVGRIGAREVVQLYLNRPAAPTGTPAAPWPLRGFERTAVLAPGASAMVSFVLQPRDLSHVLADGSRSATSPYAGLRSDASYALGSLDLHLANSERAGEYDIAASWQAYRDYLSGLLEKLQARERIQGGAAAESVATELRKAIDQVPPRP